MKMPWLLAGLALALGLVGTAQAAGASAYASQPVLGATTTQTNTVSTTLVDMAARAAQPCQDARTSACKNAPAQNSAPPASPPSVPALHPGPHPQRSHVPHMGTTAPNGGGAADGSQSAPSAGEQELGWRSLLPGSIQ